MARTTSKKKSARKVTARSTAKTVAKSSKKGPAGKKAGAKASTRKKVARKSSTRTAARSVVARVKLNSESGIRDVADLHQQLLSVVDHPQSVTIDASDVDRIDTAVLQTLTAFVRDRELSGLKTEWNGNPSEAFLRAASLIDLKNHLLSHVGGSGN